MTTKIICTACEAAHDRQSLIEALRSNRYTQHERRTIYQPLRSETDRYSVTGLATALITPMAWVKNQKHWIAFWIDDIAEHTGRHPSPDEDITDLEPEAIRHLLENATGAVRNCPALTALALGVAPKAWEKSRELQLHINPSKVPLPKLPSFGIPPRHKGKHQLDLLSFNQAADLLAYHPAAICPCSCKRPFRA